MSETIHTRRFSVVFSKTSRGTLFFTLWLLAFAPPALAGPPVHLRTPALDISGFNHACGAAVDSKGDVYVASAGESKVRIFDPTHTELTSISNSNEPCGLAVNSKGDLFVSEQKTGNVVRYKPNAYPFVGKPTYGSAEPIDSSGEAKGIAVDSFDSRLYVAKPTHIDTYSPEGTPGTSEVQRVFVNNFVSKPVTGGTYTLTFKGTVASPIPGQTTEAIDFDASPAEIEGALQGLAAIASGDVSVKVGTGGSGESIKSDVTFTGAFASKDIELLEFDGSGLIPVGNGGDAFTTTEAWDGVIADNGELTEATGIAAYTYRSVFDKNNPREDRYLFVADAATDEVKVFGGTDVRKLKSRPSIKGPKPGEDFGFGPEGAYLAVDPGNADEEGKCVSVAEQACTAGHLLVYDAAHETLNEFEASGELLDQIKDPAFADAKPTAMAIDRSGGANDGTIHLTAGDASDSELLAFGPLAAPSRAPLPELSRELAGAAAVAVDSKGNVYVAAGPLIHVYDPSGKEIAVGPGGKGIEDPNKPIELAVDSTGKVYVLDRFGDGTGPPRVTYYEPSTYPPVDGTTYLRHEPPLVTKASLGEEPEVIAVDPRNDHLLVAGSGSVTIELDSAANGSKLIRSIGFDFEVHPQSIDVYQGSGNVYGARQNGPISIVDPTWSEEVARINGSGGPNGPLRPRPAMAVDQSSGHALAFANRMGAAREYDASGAFVAEFFFPEPQRFTEDLFVGFYDIAIDNSGGPNDGVAYVAFDDTKKNTPDLWAFAPLTYGEPPLATTGTASGVGGGNATLNATVNPRSFELTGCRFEYLTDAEHQQNLEDEDPGFEGAEEESCAEGLAAIGKGGLPVPVHADVSGLDPEGRYRFRAVATNKYGPSEGKAALFGPPLIETRIALPILYDEATLRAKIDPSGLATKYHFEYGTSEAYGQSTPTQNLSAAAAPSEVAATLTGLADATTYHFRILAENEAMSVPGPDQTFTTQQRHAEQSCPNTEYRTGLSANLPDCRAYELVTPAATNGFLPVPAASTDPGTDFSNWLTIPRGPGAGERLAYFTFGTLPGFDGNGFLDGYRAQRGEGEHPKEGWRSELFAPTYEEAAPEIPSNLPSQQGVASDQLYSFWSNTPAEETFPATLPEGIYLRTPAGFEPVGRGTLGTDLKAGSRYVSPGGAHVVFFSSAQLEEEAPPKGVVAVYDRAAGSEAAEVVSLLPGDVTPTKDASYLAATEDGTAIAFEIDGALYLRRAGQTVEVAEAPSTFAGISEDGERVLYAKTASGGKPADLFACEPQAGQCVGGVEPPGLTEIAPESVFVNVSSDGSGVLFTSEEAGEHSLYAWEAETKTTSFVSGLDPQDLESFGGDTSVSLRAWTTAINPGTLSGRSRAPARATPGGEVFVFQSHAQLTSYENEGKVEIYRYDPAAVLGERLICVSCDPSGAAPSADATLVDIPAGVQGSTVVPNLTDDGRAVFFQSADPLLPEDANAVIDVYEWKANGSGGCELTAGCLALISSGQGESDSYLYSMSSDGHDVFFRTSEKLVGQDVAGSPSIYDARVEGGIPDPPVKAPCQGDACQGQGTPPPALPAAGSTAGSGNDRVEEGTPRPRCPKGKRKVRLKGGKTRCVKRPAKGKGSNKQHRTNQGGNGRKLNAKPVMGSSNQLHPAAQPVKPVIGR